MRIRFWINYEKTLSLLLNCTNTFYVSPTDKKALREDMNPLERNHLRYLF